MFNRTAASLAITLAALCAGAAQNAEPKYLDNGDLNRELRELSRSHRDHVRVRTLTKTPGKEEVRLIELGTGSADARQARPAILVTAGIEGNDQAGTVSALRWAQHLAAGYATNEQTRELLESATIYILPRLNPDATRSFFEAPRFETAISPLPKVDDDHDGLADEDGSEDLNKDGLVTSMRIEDPEGDFIIDPSEPRLMLKADHSKGERGEWRVLSEGRDNDGDENWNEDGPGGVNYNRNFPYNYRFFAPWSGVHQVSEAVTRALADFVVDHPNIAVAFTFGAADNLTQTPKAEAPKRPPTTLREEDVPFYRELGKIWREALGLKKELGGASEPGTFSDWMYFHRGRLSLAARPWSSALQLELAKTGAKDEKPKDGGDEEKKKGGEPKKENKPEPDGRNEEERKFLKWVDDQAPERFVPWQKFEHPDFPGQTVEIGGFAPFARTNPPEKVLSNLVAGHIKFLDEVARKLPRIRFRKVASKHLGDSVFELTVQLENVGYLPTTLSQGEVTREVLATRVVLDVDPKHLLAGTVTSVVAPLQGSGGMRELRYTLFAREPKLGLRAVSALAGTVRTNVILERSEP